MKKLLLAFVLCLPIQLIAAEPDSVYSWGPWSQGIKPAAGAVPSITPSPIEQPRVEFRPNENSAFTRRSIQVVETPTPTAVTPVITPGAPTGSPRPAGAPAPGATPGDRF